MIIEIKYKDRFFIGAPVKTLVVESTDRVRMTELYKELFGLMADDRISASEFLGLEAEIRDSGYTPTREESEVINAGII